MGPINYLQGIPQPDLAGSIMSGLQVGGTIAQMQAQREAQAAAQAQAQQYQQDIATAMSSPSHDAFAALSLKYPAQREAIQSSWKQLSEGQQKTEMDLASRVYAAASSGRNDIAKAALQKHVEALKASNLPTEDAQAWLDMADSDPQSLRGNAGLFLAKVMGPEKFTQTFSTIGEQQRAAAKAPAELAKLGAEAQAAQYGAQVKGVEAGNAQTAAVLGNQKTAEEIKSKVLQRDLDRLDMQIKAANSQTERDKLQLERDQLAAKQGKEAQAQSSSAQDSLDGLTQAMSTVKSVMDHPGLSKGTGLGGDAMAWISGSDAADFRAQLGVLKSQQFLTNIGQMKGTGAITDVEGKKLESAVASLETSQSPAQFRAALGTIKATLEKAQNKLAQSGKLPTQGGAYVMTHPTMGIINDGRINAIMQQIPGTTREQVIQILREAGAK